MPRVANRLTARKVETTKTPARLADGLGLYLTVEGEFSKSWTFEYQLNGTRHYVGLGSALDVSLSEAREKRDEYRRLKASGVDPLEAKRAAKKAAKLADVRKLTFAEAAKAYHQQHQASWSPKHSRQWLASLRDHAFPVLGPMDVAVITRADVLRAIEPAWTQQPVTMDRVRNRVETILNWAMARGHRPEGPNPAAWRAALDQVLPAVKKVAKVQPYAALPYSQLPAFMAKLRQQHSIAALALEFTVLTVARLSEAIGAVWGEIDLDSAMWTVPAGRMKAGKEHRVPLSPPVIELLRALPREDANPHLFIGARTGGSVGSVSMFRLLKALHPGITTHGFRSAFSDFCHEQTAFDNHTIEISLAHSVGNAVEKSYRRGDLLAKRRGLMNAWAEYCAKPAPAAKVADNVVAMRAG